MTQEPQTRTEKGISLARGPALIMGTVLLIAGLYFICKQNTFPHWSQFPNGTPTRDKVFFGIFGVNGWTGMLTAVAGGLLLFGAAQHLLAKTMSLIVAVGLGIAAVIALISGNVLGMAAANIWTELAWLGCTAILLLNTIAPRRTRTVVEEPRYVQQPSDPAPTSVATPTHGAPDHDPASGDAAEAPETEDGQPVTGVGAGRSTDESYATTRRVDEE